MTETEECSLFQPSMCTEGLAVIVLGMAGSGKSTFVQRVNAYLREKNAPPYLVNLDPAVTTVPYPVNIDIRDTVKYKDVMKEYNLGPNGGIMTCLNLMCTRFNQVVNFIKKRLKQAPLCMIDTPGQIEAFTWSASGSIITDSLASSFPTVIAFIVDSIRISNPVTFMSNMLYACSIFYRTRLPIILVFNKADVVNPSFAKKWMTDFESFQEALDSDSSSYMNDLTRSLSLVMDQFYQDLPTVTVSALNGEGICDFLRISRDCLKEYFASYRPMYEKMLQEKKELALKKAGDESVKDPELDDSKIQETWPMASDKTVIGKIHLGGVEEENKEDSKLLR